MEATVLINSKNTVNKVAVRDLTYVEVYNHMLIYHTRTGQYEAYGKLSELEADERFRRFLRVTPSHLVNCDHIASLTDDAMIVNGVKLPVSRRRRKECLEKMAALLGGGRGKPQLRRGGRAGVEPQHITGSCGASGTGSVVSEPPHPLL